MRLVHFSKILFACLICAFSSCGAYDDTSDVVVETEQIDANAISIRKQCYSIVGGIETSGYSSTVLLFQAQDDTYISRCTGTIVGENTVITAAHCVANTESGNMAMLQENCTNGTFDFLQSTKVIHHGYASDYFIEAQMLGEITPEVISRDLAILIFPIDDETSSASLYGDNPKDGDDVEVVGFGVEYSPYDYRSREPISFADITKRVGRNSLANYDNIFSELSPEQNPLGGRASPGTPEVFLSTAYDLEIANTIVKGTYSTTAQGDSGGPLFINGKLAGVTSSGATIGNSQGYPVLEVGLFTNLQSDLSRELILRASNNGANFSGWDEYYETDIEN